MTDAPMNITPVLDNEEADDQLALSAFRKRKAEILNHADMYMKLGLSRFDAFQIVDTTDMFQDDESQEFLKSLVPVTGKWMESVENYIENYSPSILADLEIYYFINSQETELRVISDYLKLKATYNETKQLIAQIFLFNGIGTYTLAESLALIAKTNPNPEILAAITIDPNNAELDAIIAKLSTILPDYMTEMLSLVIKAGSSPELYARMLEFDF